VSDDPRWSDAHRDRDGGSRDLGRGGRAGFDARERDQVAPQDVFMEHVDLPRGLDREHVHTHHHDYTLRGSETRTLSTVGAFSRGASSRPPGQIRSAARPAPG
jgi:hypothetical protein